MVQIIWRWLVPDTALRWTNLAPAVAFEWYLERTLRERFRARIDMALIDGEGSGYPTGITAE